jgi:hypothetical protein
LLVVVGVGTVTDPVKVVLPEIDRFPPMKTLPPIPIPPATTTAPEEVLVDPVVELTLVVPATVRPVRVPIVVI